MGNGATTLFSFSFIGDSASDIMITYTNASGVITTIPSSQYTLSLNAAAAGSLWGIGGTVQYPLSGSPIANGTFLTVSRLLPYTQTITISNQGDFAPQVIEEMGDTLEMQIQQLAARTTQFRGAWITNTFYVVGDIVQDSTNGNNTKNYYICQVPNTSGTWSTDLGAGDWAISVVAVVPAGGNTVILSGDITASGSTGSPIPATLAIVNSNVGQFAGLTVNGKGLVTAATALTGDITSSGAATTLATVNSNFGSFTAANITVNAKGLVTSAASGTAGKIITYTVVTDSTDISLSEVPTQANVGSTFSMNIPTKGYILWTASLETLSATVTTAPVLGLRIGSTNYWPTSVEQASIRYSALIPDSSGTTGTNVMASIGPVAGSAGSASVSATVAGASQISGIFIEQKGIPTGTQTVQIIAGMTNGNGSLTIKGTVVTTRVYVETHDFS